MTIQKTYDIIAKAENLHEFRMAVREWLDDMVPGAKARKPTAVSGDDYINFQKWWMGERAKVGLSVAHWPKEYGGAGLGIRHQAIIAEEMARSDAPTAESYVVSHTHIPATLIPWGTEDQKTTYLSRTAAGAIWCQGFSEPGAGSDLASLRTRAVRDGDDYVVNGQKIWSSNSMYAQYCILLTRTGHGETKHQGITYLLLHMDSPGVEVRPIRQANGRAEFGEIFLTDVRVPVANRLGPEGEGWKVAQSTLASERGIIAFENAERARYRFEGFYRNAVANEDAWLRDDELRREFMSLFAQLQSLRRHVRQLLEENLDNSKPPQVTSAYIKLTGTVLMQSFASWKVKTRGLTSQIQGQEDTRDSDTTMFEYMTSFGTVIASGTNEIMRNIISERGLGMPRR